MIAAVEQGDAGAAIDLDVVLIEMPTIAQALGKGWTTRRARRWLCRKGAAQKVNGRWITTPAMLREHFPAIWDKIATRALFDEG